MRPHRVCHAFGYKLKVLLVLDHKRTRGTGGVLGGVNRTICRINAVDRKGQSIVIANKLFRRWTRASVYIEPQLRYKDSP